MSETKKARTCIDSCFRIPEVWIILLRMCDVESAFHLSLIIFSDQNLWEVARDEKLWEQLVEGHFQQKRHYHPGALCPASTGVPNFYEDKQVNPSPSFIEFCETFAERELFRKLEIIQGDISSIMNINSKPIDCLIFPTNYSLRNAGSGAAAAVFRRAGPDLDEYVYNLHYNAKVSEAIRTPGFNANVDHLIHCIGPSPQVFGGHALLYQTYINAFVKARRNGAKCVAIASIATGDLGFAHGVASSLAMRAVRDFIKTYRWDATIAFVCWEGHIAQALRDFKAETLEDFNDGCSQVMAMK